MASIVLAENEKGRLVFDGNELAIESKIDDPPALRLAAPGLNSCGKISWNRLRSDGGHEELVILQGKTDERERDGQGRLGAEVTLHQRNPNVANADAAMQRTFAQSWDSKEIGGIYGGAPGVPPDPGNPPPATNPSELRDGPYLVVKQGDGNLVVYLEATMQPLWDKFSYEAGAGVPPGPTDPPPTQPPSTADHSVQRSAVLFNEMQHQVQNETGQWVDEAEDENGRPDHVAASIECVEQDPWRSQVDPLYAMIFGINGNLAGSYKEQYLRRGAPTDPDI